MRKYDFMILHHHRKSKSSLFSRPKPKYCSMLMGEQSSTLWSKAQFPMVGRGSITATFPPDSLNFWMHRAAYPHRNFSDTANLKSYKIGSWWGPIFVICIKIKVKETSTVLVWEWLLSAWGSLLGHPHAVPLSHFSPVLGGVHLAGTWCQR